MFFFFYSGTNSMLVFKFHIVLFFCFSCMGFVLFRNQKLGHLVKFSWGEGVRGKIVARDTMEKKKE